MRECNAEVASRPLGLHQLQSSLEHLGNGSLSPLRRFMIYVYHAPSTRSVCFGSEHTEIRHFRENNRSTQRADPSQSSVRQVYRRPLSNLTERMGVTDRLTRFPQIEPLPDPPQVGSGLSADP